MGLERAMRGNTKAWTQKGMKLKGVTIYGTTNFIDLYTSP